MINNFGLIWENLSITPWVPKSGEHDDHIAPIALVAIKPSTVNLELFFYSEAQGLALISTV